MALAADDLAQIEAILSAPDADGQLVADLRRRFPQVSWTRCDASDVTESPFRSYPRCEVHLLDSTDHCARITADPLRATGIVVADRRPLP